MFDPNHPDCPTCAAMREVLISQTLVDLERIHIQRVLEHHNGNISQAARHLGIYRSSLQRKLRKLGIDVLQFRSAG